MKVRQKIFLPKFAQFSGIFMCRRLGNSYLWKSGYQPGYLQLQGSENPEDLARSNRNSVASWNGNGEAEQGQHQSVGWFSEGRASDRLLCDFSLGVERWLQASYKASRPKMSQGNLRFLFFLKGQDNFPESLIIFVLCLIDHGCVSCFSQNNHWQRFRNPHW